MPRLLLGVSILLAAVIGSAPASAEPVVPAPAGDGVVAQAASPCVGGMAAGFPCDSVDLLFDIEVGQLGATTGNDCWGWTDPESGTEYALFGIRNGTAFFELTDPANPTLLGILPTATDPSLWRDIKTYANHAFVVSEAPQHGMQVFDLTRLRNVANPPEIFTMDAHYSPAGDQHNIAINEETGYAYLVGGPDCAAGLHMVDISDPVNPAFAGCFDEDGYTHDAQVVVYHGPDPDYQDREIAFAFNEDTVTIVDVTDKINPFMVSRVTYPNVGYSHQGWLTEDHTLLFQDDELDELFFGTNCVTNIWDVSDLDNPVFINDWEHAEAYTDHNQYTRGHLLYQANYAGGLRMLATGDAIHGSLTEVAYFDTWPPHNDTGYDWGAWSVYPYFKSGVVLIDGFERCSIVRPTIDQSPLCEAGGPYTAAAGSPAVFDGTGSSDPDGGLTYSWDFGDGGQGSGANPSHTYANPGTYVATLCVMDTAGHTVCCRTTVEVTGSTAVQVSGTVPVRTELLGNQPNPFNPATTISFQVAEAGPVHLKVFDAQGRQVRVLVNDVLAAGVHTAEWDGRSTAGAVLDSGVYAYRMEAGGRTYSGKMVLIK